MARLLRPAALLFPGLIVAATSGISVNAAVLPDASAPAAPASASSTGGTQTAIGLPAGEGLALHLNDCLPPCTPAAGADRGALPVGVGFSHEQSAQGNGDTSSEAPAGARATANGLLGTSAAGTAGPSGGSAGGALCLSVLSNVPVPDLSGSGFNCGSAAGFGPGAGGAAAAGASSPASGSSAGSQSGVLGQTAQTPSGAGGQPAQPAAVCQTSNPMAGLSTANRPASPVGAPLAAIAMCLLCMAAGYALAVERRRRVLN